MANSSLLAGLTVQFKADLTGLTSGIQQAKSMLAGFAGANSADYRSPLQGLANSVDLSGAVTGEDVAKAKLSTFKQDVADTGQAVTAISTKFRTDAVTAADAFGAKMSALTAPLADFSSALTNRVGSALSSFGSKIADAAQPVLNFGAKMVEAVQPVVAFGERIGQAVGSGVSTVVSKLQEAGSAVVSFGSKMASGAGQLASTIARPFQEAGLVVAGFGIKAGESLSSAASTIGSKMASMAAPVVAFGQKVAQAASPVTSFGRELASAASSALSGFSSQVVSAGSALGSFALKATEAASSGLSGFVGGIKNAAGSVLEFGSKLGMTVMGIQALVQGAMSAGQALLAPAISAEQMGSAFDTLLGSTKAAKDELEQLNTFAAKTPFQTMDIDQAAAQLVGFGIDAKSVVPDLTAIGDALSAVGHGSVAELDSVVNIFGKIQTAGKLTGGDLMQLQDHGINATKLLATAFHKTVPEIEAMTSSGLIPADKALKALTSSIEANPMYAGGMSKQANTLGGLMSTLASNVTLAADSFLGLKDGEVQAGSLFDMLKNGFSALGDLVSSPKFQQFASDTGKKIGDTLGQIGSVLEGPMKRGGEVLKDIVDQAQKIGNSDGFKAFVKNASDLGNTIKNEVSPFVKPLFEDLKNLFTDANIKTGAKNVGDSFGVLGNVLGSINTDLKALPVLMGKFNTFMAPLTKDLVKNFTDIGSAWDKGGGKLDQSLKDLNKDLGPLAPQLAQFGAALAGLSFLPVLAGLNGLMGGISGMVPGLIQMVTGVTQIFDGLGVFFDGFGKVILDIFTGNTAKIKKDWEEAWKGLQKTSEGIWNAIAGSVSAFVGGIMGTVEGWVKGFTDLFKGMSDTLVGHSIVPDMINSMENWFKSLPGKLTSAVAAIPSQIGGVFSGMATSATTYGANIVKNLASGIRNAISDVTSAVTDVTSWISAHLPHSPAKVGPLRDLPLQGRLITEQIASGMLLGIPTLQSALGQVVAPVANIGVPSTSYPLQGSRSATSVAAASGGGAGSNNGGDNHFHIYIGGEKVAHIQGNAMMRQYRQASRGGRV